MNYTIEEYTNDSISQLKEAWLTLEKGDDMTYYQSYKWNIIVQHFTPQYKGICKLLYLLVKQGEKPLLIAPLWIVEKTLLLVNKKGAYLIGRKGWSDYLNFVYTDCSNDVFKLLFDYIYSKLHLSLCCLEQIKEDTKLYAYLSQYVALNKDSRTTCVSLMIPESVDDYKQILSKKSRQNIRTANNRLNKDGKSIVFSFDDHPDLSICESMRQERVDVKNKFRIHSLKELINCLKTYFKNKFIISFPVFLPFYEDKSLRFISAYIDGELAAYFCYGLDEYHKKVVLMAVGTNNVFAKYSPGVLALYAYVLNLIECKEILLLDFTRGDEKYKYSLGGVNHYIHDVSFNL